MQAEKQRVRVWDGMPGQHRTVTTNLHDVQPTSSDKASHSATITYRGEQIQAYLTPRGLWEAFYSVSGTRQASWVPGVGFPQPYYPDYWG